MIGSTRATTTTTTTTTTASGKIRAIAWDPSSPATLHLPTVTATSTPSGSSTNLIENFRVDCTLSHDGVGCNPHEASALLNLLDARDAYLESFNNNNTTVETGLLTSSSAATDFSQSETMLAVSRAYRKAICDCVLGWESDLNEKSMNEKGEEEEQRGTTTTTSREHENLDLLKTTFAMIHLSEPFLLMPHLAGQGGGDGSYFEYDNPSTLPGATTAETVRYLRFHHMVDPESVCDDYDEANGGGDGTSTPIFDELTNSIQPDQLDGGEPFWKLVESYLIRGCLEDVWGLLSRHSLNRQAQEALTVLLPRGGMDEYQAATLTQDYNGFRALEALLLSAPLPGGRNDENDAYFMLHDDEQQQQHPPQGTNGEGYLLDGISPHAYRLWEASSDHRGSGDFPIHFQSNAALQVYRTWQHAVKTMPEVQTLKRRIPQLQRVLSILSGDFTGVTFPSWAEELCAELLYKAPQRRLADMHIRASRLMEKHLTSTGNDNDGDEEDETTKAKFFNDVVLSVMKGNAGRAVEVLHILGGGSGAALPAVMTSLLCDLLDDARLIPNVSAEYSVRTELLLNAAFAVRSSFSVEGQSDLGTRLVARLLLPHITVDSDVTITAHLVDAMEHHYPKTDAEAKNLLELCRKLVERKNRRILDGCVAICLARYRYYLSDERPGGAVHWLLTGMDMEALCMYGPNRSNSSKAVTTGVCYRLLVTIRLQTSETLLKGLLGGGEGVSLVYASGKEVVLACQESDIAGTVPSVKVLEHVVAIAEAIAERKDDSLVASNIVSCLEDLPRDEVDDDEGLCLARPTMHWDLLCLAKLILDRNTERDSTMEELHLHTASFDVRGMHVLLERLTILLATYDMMGQPNPGEEIVYQTRLTFAEGLMRAFVAENAMKQSNYINRPRKSVDGVYAANLGKLNRERQELVVQSMLDF